MALIAAALAGGLLLGQGGGGPLGLVSGILGGITGGGRGGGGGPGGPSPYATGIPQQTAPPPTSYGGGLGSMLTILLPILLIGGLGLILLVMLRR